MQARAPGKLVLSGAYSVLEGAPALVAAVDRYVVADATRDATFVTDELKEAIRLRVMTRPVWFDAAALRENTPNGESRKLGLGSSAAILVASLGAAWPRLSDEAELGSRLFPEALAIHRAAQRGGSGIDVAASCFGGILACRIATVGLEVAGVTMPRVAFEAWACRQSASTSEMLAQIRMFAVTEPAAYRKLIGDARGGAEAAVAATEPSAFIEAIVAQRTALAELGARSGTGIMTAEVDALHACASAERAAFYPAGAGGGDVALFLGLAASSEGFRARAEALGLMRIELGLGARGVHRS